MTNVEMLRALKQIAYRVDALAHVVRQMEGLLSEEQRQDEGVKQDLAAIQGDLEQTLRGLPGWNDERDPPLASP